MSPRGDEGKMVAMPTTSVALAALTAIVAIAGATVAVCLGHIDSSTYAAIVAGFGGAGVGVGAHSAGVAQSAG